MRDNSRDGLMVEFWDSSQGNNATGEKFKLFNDGRIFREFIIPTHCDCKWPMPENYSPKETSSISARRCCPQIAISLAAKKFNIVYSKNGTLHQVHE